MFSFNAVKVMPTGGILKEARVGHKYIGDYISLNH
jgi:hypothetical protein